MSSDFENPEQTKPDVENPDTHEQIKPVALGEATRVWAKIGLLSFGGPAGQIALMHRILVEEKRWISEDQFLHALNFCMLLPGPEAQQLATYIGWLLHRIRGGLIAGCLFIIPGFMVIMALSYLYVVFGNVPLVQGLYDGLKASVIIIVLQAVIRIGRRVLKSKAAIILAVGAFIAMFLWKIPFPLVILFSAIYGMLITRFSRKPDLQAPINKAQKQDTPAMNLPYMTRCIVIFAVLWLTPIAVFMAAFGPDNVFTNISVFFSKMAVVTFGGAYAVLGYLSQEAVTTYQWLAPGEMMDGLAMAETTPGPLIMVTQFVGFIAGFRDPGSLQPGFAALLGGTLTTWVTFVPCFMWIFVGAPFIERLRHNHLLASALSGVTIAVVGVILNLAFWFSIHTLFSAVSSHQFAGAMFELPVLSSVQLPSLVIAVIAAVLVFRFRISVIGILVITGTIGMAWSLIPLVMP